MKKYIVICYAVHKKEIASHDAFDNEDDAYAFLEKVCRLFVIATMM